MAEVTATPQEQEKAQQQDDGLVRAKWVDGSIKPKKHGAFEGVFKGDDKTKPRLYYWTGRRWYYVNHKGKWAPSVFGLPGDKWRGLVDDVLQSVAMAEAGDTCEDEGCPQFGTPHSHPAEETPAGAETAGTQATE